MRQYDAAVRTAVTIGDELYRTARDRAARTGRTVDEVIEDALRAACSARADAGHVDAPQLRVYGGTGVLAGVDLKSNAALHEVMDAGAPVDALR